MRHTFALGRVVAAIGVVAAITALYIRILPVNPTTAALSYLVAILPVAAGWGIVEATAASVAAVLCFNFFFLPPVGTFTIADPQNWVAFLAFLVTAVVASQLSGRARQRNIDAVARERDLERLYALSRSLLLSPGGPSTPDAISRHIAEAFELQAVAVYDHHTDTVSRAGPAELPAIEGKLRDVARQAVSLREGAEVVTAIRLGGAPIGSLALLDPGLSDTVLQSIANLAAIGLERARGQEAASRAEAARQSGELRATVLDALAHEFKTPLTSMKAATSDVLSRTSGKRDRELLGIVDEELDRLQALVSDAVHMLRIDAGHFVVHPDRHNVRDVLGWTLRQFEPRLDGHPIVTVVPDDLSVDVDRELLGLAIRQLLDNAVKYSLPTSRIEITATANGMVDIAVRNAGAPIPARERAHLFERFYRGSHARHVPGTGMGLAIVQQIAEAHGGTLSVSSSPERGNEFTVSLPRESSSR